MRTKKILIASFFAVILMLVPLHASASTMQLDKNDMKQLDKLVEKIQDNNVKIELKTVLNRIIVNNNIDTIALENILTSYYEENTIPSFIDTDAWGLIIDRLGWVYTSVESFLNIYYSGMNLYNQFSYKTSMFLYLFQSLKDLRSAWQAFRQQPLQNLMNIIDALRNTINAISRVINDLTDGETEIIDALNDLIASVSLFSDYLSTQPWNKPIHIFGEISGSSSSVTVSCGKDNVTTKDHFDLYFSTYDEAYPYLVHKVVITADNKTAVKYSFSDGKIQVDFDFSNDNSNSKAKSFLNLFNKIPQRIIDIFLNIFPGFYLKNIFL